MAVEINPELGLKFSWATSPRIDHPENLTSLMHVDPAAVIENFKG